MRPNVPLVVCALVLLSGAPAFSANDAATPESASAEAPGEAAEDGEAKPKKPDKTVCQLIEEAAVAHTVPIGFLTRLIWRESNFRSEVVSPKGAQGIAQFMPGTASHRRLADPFDPAAAIPASANYLSDLSRRFGNLGLAAAAYNAGEKRVSDWLAGTGGLPWETRDYVFIITGRSAEGWAAPIAEPATPSAVPPPKPVEAEESCVELAAVLAKPGAGSQVVQSVEQAPWAPWGVQVAGNFSLNRAMASYTALQRAHPAVLAGRLPLVVRAVNKSRGRAPLFQIRLPEANRDSAAALCRKLQSAGGACLVFRN